MFQILIVDDDKHGAISAPFFLMQAISPIAPNPRKKLFRCWIPLRLIL